MWKLSVEERQAVTPLGALNVLVEGHKRFIKNLKKNRNMKDEVSETADCQAPFAVIISCMDSRTAVEAIFDQGMGDVLSIRNAGGVIDDTTMGGLEFAISQLRAKIIVVMGHTDCGAVKGACDNLELGHLTNVLKRISPSVFQEKTITENRTSRNAQFVTNVSANHVKFSVKSIVSRSEILKARIDAGECGIIGAQYDIKTGKVTFYNQLKFGFDQHKGSGLHIQRSPGMFKLIEQKHSESEKGERSSYRLSML